MKAESDRSWWRRLRWLRWILAICLMLILLFLHRDAVLPCYFRWLDVGQPPEKSDFVMILLGDEDTRPFVAAALVNRNLASDVLIAQTETAALPAETWPAGHQVAQGVLTARGVSKERIRLLPAPSANTFGEARALADFLNKNPNATVTVVTNHFHSRRARWAFRRAAGRDRHRLRFVSAPHDDFDASNWWRSRCGFTVCTTECLRLAFYVLRHGNGVWWCAAAVGSIIALGIGRYLLQRRRLRRGGL